ncbi:MAG: hypothetical protein JSV57_01265 [Candidatus Bathyarchaeota archaeon]|nr:MAG: hypothetical protein JSV57_01265 [Candidatus Bathyarchaeota archaeon]
MVTGYSMLHEGKGVLVILSLRSESTEGSKTVEKVGGPVYDDVREEWRLLWRHCFVDKVRAESVANQDYPLLFVDRGVVIIATRAFALLDFREILNLHKIRSAPHPSVGGWGKFARTVLSRQERWKQMCDSEESAPRRDRKKNLQRKKGGVGWLHYRMKG